MELTSKVTAEGARWMCGMLSHGHSAAPTHTWRSELGDARQRNGVSGSVRSGVTGWAGRAGSSGEKEGVRLPREAGGDVRV